MNVLKIVMNALNVEQNMDNLLIIFFIIFKVLYILIFKNARTNK